jgi:hypothetical protein
MPNSTTMRFIAIDVPRNVRAAAIVQLKREAWGHGLRGMPHPAL